jgi:hypothetical protein
MKPLLRIVLTAGCAAAIVAGLFVVGDSLREGLRERHVLAVHDIDCDPPAGRTRREFLDEVHYHGRLPEKLNALDADLPERIKTAFAKHPDVLRVEKVTVTPPNLVRVELTYRNVN